MLELKDMVGRVHEWSTRLLDELECGLVICDEGCGVHFANRVATAELRSGRALSDVAGRLCASGRQACDFAPAVRSSIGRGTRRMLMLGEGAHGLLVSVLPVTLPYEASPLALLVLGRRQVCSELGLEMLGSAYQLTWAERRVLGCLVQQLSPREIARHNGVAISTVRTQIASLRAKFASRSVDELLLRVAMVPPVCGALRLAPARSEGRSIVSCPKETRP